MRILLFILTIAFAGELEVQGDLKVTGSVDANGNPITNVGEPVLTTDVATANYVNSRTAGKGRIITLKCPWNIYGLYYAWPLSSCEPPACPDGWNELVISNEVAGVTMSSTNGANDINVVGNSVRYCIEQEDEE